MQPLSWDDSFTGFLVSKGFSNDDVWVARGTVFQDIRPGAAFETDDFVKEKLGGGTVERLPAGLTKYGVHGTEIAYSDPRPLLSRKNYPTLLPSTVVPENGCSSAGVETFSGLKNDKVTAKTDEYSSSGL